MSRKVASPRGRPFARTFEQMPGPKPIMLWESPEERFCGFVRKWQ